LLLAHVLAVPRTRLPAGDNVDAAAAGRFRELTGRRAARVPLQHLIGSAAFRYLELAVGPGVFVPRPETELLVDAVLPVLRYHADPVVVDLCAGSGAIALAIAQEVPDAQVYAVERCPNALQWLRQNASARAAAGDRPIDVIASDIAAPDLVSRLPGRVDVVVSNPPYVPTHTQIAPEAAADPPEALFAGVDGLALMPAVIEVTARLLRPAGAIAVEHDETHGAALPALLTADGRFTAVEAHRDLSGRPRFVTARRR
jgi:release factor glutamine methyltransferase